MKQPVVRLRSEIPDEYKWNAPSVFAGPAEFEAAAAQMHKDILAFDQYRGRIHEGPEVLAEVLNRVEDLIKAAGKIITYASLTQAVNTADPTGAQMSGRAYALYGQLSATAAFLDPEILAVGRETVENWLAESAGLQVYSHYLENLFRKQSHVRSSELEELLGMVSVPFAGTGQTASMLTDADFRFSPARSETGEELPVTQGTVHEIYSGPDRTARRTAWESYTGTYLAFKNTLASNLATSIHQNVFSARARRYPSSLEYKLFEYNIPVEVFYNLIEVFRSNLPTWHRYWAVRRKALGVEKLYPYDVWAPLTRDRQNVPYAQAVDWVCAALAPLGEDYVRIMRRGLLEQRWVDVYPSQGKASSQFSSGGPATHPFIFLNYDDTLFSASTLAHELGHSMHSYLTWHNQPAIYSDYSLFVAEVASNFHQAMLRAYLLANHPDPAFQISLIEEAMSNFHRYFFIMPTLARFELEMHQHAEKGEGLSADLMNERMLELFAEGYGSELDPDGERTGITWATFGHLYEDYYVYQYATGISAANALSRHILAGEPGAVERYLGFLRAGSSVYPLDILKQAGVDLATPKPVEEAFEVLSGLVDRLEKLVG